MPPFRRSADFARAVFDASADGILVTDGDGVVVTCNAAALELLGRSEEALVGSELGVPSGGGAPGTGLEIQVVRGDGRTRTVELRTSDTVWQGEELTVVTLRDITRRVEAERELQESQALLAQFAEHAEGVFFLVTAEGEILYASPGTEELVGEPVDFDGTSGWLSYVHPEDRERHRRLLDDPGRAPYDVEYRIVRADGEVRWVRQRGFPVREGDGRSSRVAGWVEDVTERHRDRERVEQTRRLLARTVASLREAVLVVGPSRTIVDANPAVETVFGYTPDELVGGTTEPLHVTRSSFERFAREGEPELERSGVFHAEYRMRRKDGTVFDAEQTVTLLDPEKGLEGGVVSVCRDVSERREAERRLRESEARFRQIAEHIQDVFWVATVGEGRTEYVSPAFEEIWGRSRESIYRNPELWAESMLPSDRARILATLDTQVEGGWEQEYRIVRPDGEVRWIWDRAFAVEGPDGNVERLVGVAEDITDRKQAEQRFGVLSQEISDVIYVCGPDGTILFATPPAGGFGGYDREELEGEDAFSFVHPDDRSAVVRQFEALAADPGRSARAEYRVIGKDGEAIQVESVARNRLDHPAIGGIVVTTRDITERVALERQLRQSQKMEAVGRLAGGIAHDFNNLLTVIRSQTDLLLMDLPEGSSLADEVRAIQDSADRAARLTGQLLAFSRDQILRPRTVDLSEAVRGMAHLFERVLGEDIRIVRDFADDLPPIRIDPGQLEQVLLNLAVNARDAMPEGGALTLQTFGEEVEAETAAEMAATEAGTAVCLRVADTGVGMEPEVRSRIFDPFFTTKEKEKGTGLGLAMVYGFVKQSGGSIRVESEPGTGSVFLLRFPAVDGTAEPTVGRESRDGVERLKMAGRVLVVEDDADVRRVTRRILERSGLEVDAVEDSESALRLLERDGDIGLLLTDLVLPGMSGRGLVAEILETRPDIPVVVMSGYAEESPGERGDLPEEVGFIQKPFTPEGLVGVLREVLRKG